MARSRKDRTPTGGPTGCTTCGVARPRDQTERLNWSARAPFVHCDGSVVAWLAFDPPDNPHHGHVVYPPCWSCGGAMGCDQCAGLPQDVLCTRCVVWLFPSGLAQSGPLLNSAVMVARRQGTLATPVTSYPEAHQRLYRATAPGFEMRGPLTPGQQNILRLAGLGNILPPHRDES